MCRPQRFSILYMQNALFISCTLDVCVCTSRQNSKNTGALEMIRVRLQTTSASKMLRRVMGKEVVTCSHLLVPVLCHHTLY